MVKQISHGNMNSYFYIDGIAKILKARRSEKWMMSKNQSFPVQKIFWISISRHRKNGEIIKNTYIRQKMSMQLDIKHKVKGNMIYKI